MISSKPLRNRDSWGNVMVASRNQQHVMSRAFGSTPNGSLPAYGAEGEMSTYLNGRRQRVMRGLGAGPKPKMQPATKGEVMESTEISTRFGWGAVFIVKDANGYYICEHYCPSSKRVVRNGKYPTMAEAKASCERVKSQLRNKGKVTGLSGLNGYSNMGFISIGGATTAQLVGAGLVYVGLDFPGARPFFKTAKRMLREPDETVRNLFLVTGLGALMLGGAGIVGG